MWKDSIDTLLYKVAYKKEGWFDNLFKEGGQTLIKEGVQAGAKELTQVGVKELGQIVTKEGTQLVLNEGAQSLSKEFGQKLFSEGSQNLTKEGSQTLSKEFSTSLSKEFSQQTTNQLAQSGTSSTVKKMTLGGLTLGSLIALDNIQTTDTNGDGVIDDKDKSLLDKGIDTTAGAVGEVGGKLAGGVIDAAGDVGGSLLEELGIDIEVVKDYAWKVLYVILFIIGIILLNYLYSGWTVLRKIIGRGEHKKINLYSSIIQKI